MKHLSLALILVFVGGVGAINGQKAPAPAKKTDPVAAHKPSNPQADNQQSGLGLSCPCYIIGVEGTVYMGDHKIKNGEKITSKQNIRFSTNGDILTINDKKGQNHYLQPKDFSVDFAFPCHRKGVDCTPVLRAGLEAKPAQYGTTLLQDDSSPLPNESPQPKIKLIKPFSPDKN